MGALACTSHSVALVNVQLQNIKTNLFQSKLSNGFQCLYVPVKERERACYHVHFLFLIISYMKPLAVVYNIIKCFYEIYTMP